jgi:hypothetical protein
LPFHWGMLQLTFTPFDFDLAKLVAALPQASSLDLYRLEYAVQRLRSEPQRILAIRRRLHLGMTVHFFSAHDGTMHTGRIVALRSSDVTIDDAHQNARWSGVPFAALDLQAADSVEVEIVDAVKPRPMPKRLTRADFSVGDTVSFLDRDQQTRIGRIVRMNPKTATIDCDNGNWRVSFPLLQHVVDL